MGKKVLKRKERVSVSKDLRMEAFTLLKSSLPENIDLTKNARLEELLAYGYMQQAGIIFDKDEKRIVTIGDTTTTPDIVCEDFGVEVTTRGHHEECAKYGPVYDFFKKGQAKYSAARKAKANDFLVVPLERKQDNMRCYGDTRNSLFVETLSPVSYQQLSEAKKALMKIQRKNEKPFENLVCKSDSDLYLINKQGIEKTTVVEPDWDFSGYQYICDYYNLLTGYISNKKSSKKTDYRDEFIRLNNDHGKEVNDYLIDDFVASMSR